VNFDFTANRRAGPDLLITLPVLLLVVFALPWLAFHLAYQQYVPLIVGVFIFADICFTFAWWRASVYLFVVYVLVEGFLVNTYSLPALNLLKDAELVLIFFRLALALIARRTFPVPQTGWVIAFFLFAIYYSSEIFNPLLPSILVGLIGVRVTLEFFLCFVVGYWFFNDRAQVVRFLRFHNWLSISISIFGVVQYFTGPDLLLRISPGFERTIFYAYDPNNLSVGYYFRTISTFASSAGFSQYLWVSSLLTILLMSISRRTADRTMGCLALLAQSCGMLSTGGRGPFILLFASLFLGSWLLRRLRLAFASAALLVACFVLSMIFLGPVVRTRFSTILDFDMIRERNTALAVGEFDEAMTSPIVGLGAGMGCTATLRMFPDAPVVWTENQFARMRNEGGLAGLVLFVVVTAAMLIDIWRTARRLYDPQLKVVGCIAASYCITNILVFPIGAPLDVPPVNFYFWFLLGLLYALVRTEMTEAAQGYKPATEQPWWSFIR